MTTRELRVEIDDNYIVLVIDGSMVTTPHMDLELVKCYINSWIDNIMDQA